MFNYDERDITRRFVFGVGSPEEIVSEYDRHILRNPDIEPLAVEYDMKTYMTLGGGRYAYLSLFGAIREFFEDVGEVLLDDKDYTYAELQNRLLLNFTDEDRELTISQYGTDVFSEDHPDRAWIFGTTNFQLIEPDDSVIFRVQNGVKSIIGNLEVIAEQDNFDFMTNNDVSQWVGQNILQPIVDPYELNRGAVPILYTGSGRIHTNYTEADFNADQARENVVNIPGTEGALVRDADGIARLGLTEIPFNLLPGIFDNGIEFGTEIARALGRAPSGDYLLNLVSDPFLSYTNSGNRTVIYGSPENDNIDGSNTTALTLNAVTQGKVAPFSRRLIVGGPGNDTINGTSAFDAIYGGTDDDTIDGRAGDDNLFGEEGNDTIHGQSGADEILGGAGNDSLDGGSDNDDLAGGAGNDTIEGGVGVLGGRDRAIYLGSSAEYEIEFLPNDVIRITDTVSSRDGTDLLTNVEAAVFTDRTVDLTERRDVAIVIDSTGSMRENGDATKAAAIAAINETFDRYLNTRISVVTYNDPGTATVLSFTDQPKVSDRKFAAINAINSITFAGGGDLPEVVSTGLLRALSGRAGAWRDDSTDRTILLFGDGPVKDQDLDGLATNLANDPNNPELLALAEAVDYDPANSGINDPQPPEDNDDDGGFCPDDILDGAVINDGGCFTLEAATPSIDSLRSLDQFPTDSNRLTAAALPTEESDPEISVAILAVDLSDNNDSGFDRFASSTGGTTFSGLDTLDITATLTAAPETPPNTAPIASDDSGNAEAGGSSIFIDVLANDSEPDGDDLAITFLELSTSSGTVTIDDNGTPLESVDDGLRYTPDSAFVGTDTFSYTVSDGNGGTDTATVTVTVSPRNDRPVGTDDSIEVETAEAITIDVLGNDSDPNDDPLSILAFSDQSLGGGIVQRDDNGTPNTPSDDRLIYTSAPDFEGADRFSYIIGDDNGGVGAAIVNINVTSSTVDDSVDPGTGIIGDRVWLDTNKNGLLDKGEKGLKGVTVVLTDAGPDEVLGSDDDVTMTKRTNAAGKYQFKALQGGTYQVSTDHLPLNLAYTTVNEGQNDRRDSDVDPLTGNTGPIVLAPKEVNRKVDIGLVTVPADPNTGKMGNKVWLDGNENGIFDAATEAGVPGVTVVLETADANGIFKPVATKVTNAKGKYRFKKLPGGDYRVSLEALPAGSTLYNTQYRDQRSP